MSTRRPLRTLVGIQWGSNTGYAIAPLERLFYDVAVELAQGDPSRVYFSYGRLDSGRPQTLPPDFPNVFSHDMNDRSPDGLRQAREIIDTARPDFFLSFDMQPVHPVYRLMRESGVRTIISYWGAPMSSLNPLWKRSLKRLGLVASRERLDGLIFESQAMADLAIFGRGVPRVMIDIVPLGVDVERFRPAPSRHVYDVLPIPPERRVAVFSGHCTPRKGIQTLIDGAIELLEHRGRKDIQILVCGNQEDEARPYEAQCVEHGIVDRVLFAGYRTDLLEIFQSAYCGVIPSSGWDSFPRSAVEMSGTGLPVVASRLQGLCEAVLDGQTGLLFEPGSGRALADCVERLLENPALAARLGRAGRERCERELTLAVQRRKFMAAVTRHLPREWVS